MKHHEIRNIFSKVFNGQKNIMTPDVLRYGKAGDYYYELSQSDSHYKNAFGGARFGVTVLDHLHNKTDLSKSFNNLNSAELYIKSLKGL